MKDIGGWDYSTTMRNLLRPLMDKVGIPYGSLIDNLQFDKASSEHLQEKLEYADFRDEDIHRLILDALDLHVGPSHLPSAPSWDSPQVPSNSPSNSLVNEVVTGTVRTYRPTYNINVGVQGKQMSHCSPDRTQPYLQPPVSGGEAFRDHHTTHTNFSAVPPNTQKPPTPHSAFSAYYNPPHLP
jgi:hypothetical protein